MNYKEVIESRYNRQKWQELLHDIFGNRADLWATPFEISTNNDMAKQAFWLGTITLADNESIAVYEVELSDKVDIERNRRGIRDMLLTEWRNRDAGAFMFCYRKNESVLRFSYVSEAWNFAEDGTYTKESTDTKRFTYLLGEGHRSRTAIQQFEKLKASSLKLKDLTKAFSVEAVSDMFFNEYKKNYEDIIQYITGKRMVKVANKWEEKVMNDPCEEIMQEFAHFPNPEKSVRDYVKKLMGRLVFLQYLQKKGWLGVEHGEWKDGDPEFVQNLFRRCEDKDHFVDKVLEDLFNELNTEHSIEQSKFKVPYLNGGLFEREATDETNFPLPAKYMQQMLDFFASYNFTIDENDPDDAEVGVDPEMLGRIFENLLEDNKDKGAFYTPKEIVTYMCRESLIAYLQTEIEDEATKEAIREFVTTHEKNDMLPTDTDQKLKDVKICDPAIGSGAFPMGLLKELFQCRTALEGIEQNKAAEIKKHIIQNNIYGVDIERGAVDIARLRFWLSLIVDEESPQALPNLDYKIVEGNSLITTFDGQYIDLEKGKGEARFRSSLINIQKEKKLLQEEQKRFFTLSGEEKYRSEIEIKKHILNTIWYQLDFEKHSWQDATIEQAGLFGAIESKGRKKNTAQIAEFTPERQEVLNKCEALQAMLKDDSKSLQERAGISISFFEWETVFSEIFDENGKKGFDIVIGNPPYIQLQANKGELADLYSCQNFKTFVRTGDIYSLFYEKGWEVLRNNGCLCFITSNKWMRAGYGEQTRAFFANYTNPELLIDFSGVDIFETATVVTNILLFTRSENKGQTACVASNNQDKDCIGNLSDFVKSRKYIQNLSTSEGWILLTPSELAIKNKIINAGTPLINWDVQINYGIKTGFNDAFIITTKERNEIIDNCHCEDERIRTIELIRPLLRGKDINRNGFEWANLWLINTHNGYKDVARIDINEYPAVKKHLDKYWTKISQRGDKGDTPYNLRSCAYIDEFRKPKVIYPETTKGARFAFDESGIYIDKTCFMLISDSAQYLQKTLSSKLFEVAYNKMFSSVELVNHTYQYNKHALLKLPIIKDDSAINQLSAINDEQQIDLFIYHLYGLTYDEVLIIDPTPPFTRKEYESDKYKY